MFTALEIRKQYLKIHNELDIVVRDNNSNDLEVVATIANALVNRAYGFLCQDARIIELYPILRSIDELEDMTCYSAINDSEVTIFDVIDKMDIEWNDFTTFTTMIKANYGVIKVSDDFLTK